MMYSRKLMATVLFGMAISGGATLASAEGVQVTVSLWDKGDMAMESMGQVAPMGMAMMGADMSMATMGITTDVQSVAAGEVTFVATNNSTETIHEMIVAPVADLNAALPYDSNLMRVDEDGAGSLGEVAELEPGQAGSLTLHLRAGTYILYCNIAGHYEMGMWTLISVTE